MQPMTEAEFYVLLALTEPLHGYALMNEISKVSQSRVVMGPGTLYGVLARMQNEKLIRLYLDDGRRKAYCLTEDGLKALRAEYSRLAAMVRDGDERLKGDGEHGA